MSDILEFKMDFHNTNITYLLFILHILIILQQIQNSERLMKLLVMANFKLILSERKIEQPFTNAIPLQVIQFCDNSSSEKQDGERWVESYMYIHM